MRTSEMLLNFLRDHRDFPIRSMAVFNFLLEATLCGAVLILIVLLVRRFLRGKLGNRAMYLAWLFVAIRLLLPIALPNPLMNELRPTLSTDAGARPIADQIRVRFQDGMSDLSRVIEPDHSQRYPDEGYTLSALTQDIAAYTSYGFTGKWFLLGYLVVDAGVLCYMVVRNAVFNRRLKKRFVSALSGDDLEMYQALCKRRRVKPLPVYYFDSLPCAHLVGVLNPYIALPSTLKPDELPLALAHGLCHRKAHDEWWGVLRNLCCVVHWFNPLVWIAAQCSRVDCELACDERVAVMLTDDERIACAGALALAVDCPNAPPMSAMATGMTMTEKSRQRRIAAIKESRKARRWGVAVFMLLMLAVTLLAFATAEDRSQDYDYQLDKAQYKWLMDEPFTVEIPVMEPIEQRSIQTEAEAEAYAREMLNTRYLSRDAAAEAEVPLQIMRCGDEWRVAQPGVDEALEMYFNTDGKLLYYDARIYKSYMPYPYPPTNSIRESVQRYVTAFAESCLSLTDIRVVTLEEDGYDLDGRFIVGQAKDIYGNGIFRYMLDLPTMTVLRFFDCNEAAWAYGTDFSEMVACMRNDMTETSIYANFEAKQIARGVFGAEVADGGVWRVTFTIPADALTHAQQAELIERYGTQDPFVLERLGTPFGGRLNNASTLEEYLSQFISEEKADACALQMLAQGNQRPESDFILEETEYIPESALFIVTYHTDDAIPLRGEVAVDARLGAAISLTMEQGVLAEPENYISAAPRTTVTPAPPGTRAIQLSPTGTFTVSPIPTAVPTPDAASFTRLKAFAEDKLLPLMRAQTRDELAQGETDSYVALADNAGLPLSVSWRDELLSRRYASDFIYSLARSQLGPQAVWTAEQAVWVEKSSLTIAGSEDEALVHALPAEGELDEAAAIAMAKNMVPFEEGAYTIAAGYSTQVFDDWSYHTDISVPVKLWQVDFFANGTLNEPFHTVAVSPTGDVSVSCVDKNLGTDNLKAKLERMAKTKGDFSIWSAEDKAHFTQLWPYLKTACGELIPSTYLPMLFHRYGLPEEGGLSEAEAIRLATEAVNAAYTPKPGLTVAAGYVIDDAKAPYWIVIFCDGYIQKYIVQLGPDGEVRSCVDRMAELLLMINVTPTPDATSKPAPVSTLYPLTLPEKDGVTLIVQVMDVEIDAAAGGGSPKGTLLPEEVISLAMDAIVKEYDITRQDLSNGYINYSRTLPREGESDQAISWWLNFMNQSQNTCYSVSVQGPHGRVIEVYGPEESNG